MIYLCAAPQELPSARRAFSHIAHAACHISSNGRLRTSLSSPCAKEDLLLLTSEEHCTFPDPTALCRTLRELCSQFGLQNIAADFPSPVTAEKLRFLSLLSKEFTVSGNRLWIPEEFASASPASGIVVCTAMSGGIFTKRLEEAVNRFGRDRIALDIQRLMMVFPIPSPTGTGTSLSQPEFKKLFLSQRPAVFFSRELCTKYFTYRHNGQLHLILFDDISTLLEKIRIGRQMGVSHFFLSYPEITDILGALSLAINKEKTL